MNNPPPTQSSTATVSTRRSRSVRRYLWLLLVLLPVCGVAWTMRAADRTSTAAVYGYEVVNTYPHDPNAYCQGLVYHDGMLYEGTGRYGGSSVRHVELKTGRVAKMVRLHSAYFGEGITIWNDNLVQLTWQKQVGIIYDRETLKMTNRFRYSGEGWGLTHDGTHLIMSDGTDTIRYLDPETFQVVRRIRVADGRRRIRKLNELEYIDGEIWANIWFQDHIARISPETGQVVGWVDLRGILPARLRRDRDHVLNGIAYDQENDRIFVTGKNWPRLFEIKVLSR